MVKNGQLTIDKTRNSSIHVIRTYLAKKLQALHKKKILEQEYSL